MNLLFGEKTRVYERLIGIKMWRELGAVMIEMHRRVFVDKDFFEYSENSWYLTIYGVVLTYGYTRDRAEDCYHNIKRMITDLDSISITGNLNMRLRAAWSERIAEWEEFIQNTITKLSVYRDYCAAISAVEKKTTWKDCELCVYLVQQGMQQKIAVNICKNLGAITRKHLMQIELWNIYAEEGLPITDGEKNKLNEIWLTAHAEAAAAANKIETRQLLLQLQALA